MHCPICDCFMQSFNSQTIEEEYATLVVISWQCGPCDQPYEEIVASQGYQGMQRRRLLYPVRSIESSVPSPMRRLRRTTRSQAHAVMG